MIELCIPIFWFFDLTLQFWRENDVTRLTAELKLQDMAKKLTFFKKRAPRNRYTLRAEATFSL